MSDASDPNPPPAAAGSPGAVELLEAGRLYFKQHFDLAMTSTAFVLNTARGVHLLERAAERARVEADPKLEYEALAMLGIYHSNMQKLDRALEYYEQARKIISAHPRAPWGRSAAMNANNTSGIYRKMGRYADEIHWLERSRAAFETGGHMANIVVADLYLGQAYRDAGRLDDSVAAYLRGIALAIEMEQRGEIPWLKWGYGETLAKKGDLPGALAELQRAEEIFAAAGEATHLPPLYRSLYDVAKEMGDAELTSRYDKLVLAGEIKLPAEPPQQ